MTLTLSQPASAGLVLDRHAVATLRPQGKPVELRVRTGRLWVTQAGRPEDIVLEPGDTFQSQGSGLVVVEALEPSTFAVPHAG